eukprot:365443-Chlamydomonas_euryale.AAC.10
MPLPSGCRFPQWQWGNEWCVFSNDPSGHALKVQTHGSQVRTEFIPIHGVRLSRSSACAAQLDRLQVWPMANKPVATGPRFAQH